MPNELIIRGLPRSLAYDGWWLASESGASIDPTPAPATPGKVLDSVRRFPRAPALILLVLLGDLLFWGYKPGFSLAIFAWCIFAAAWVKNLNRSRPLAPAVVLLLATLPLVEHVQLLSMTFMIAGLLSAIVLLQIPPEVKYRQLLSWLAGGVLRLIKRVPTVGLKDCAAQVRGWRNNLAVRSEARRSSVHGFIRNWAFPLGGLLVLSTLLISANPVLEHMLARMLFVDFDLLVLIRRIVFWVGLALLIWPLLTAPSPDTRIPASVQNWGMSRLLNAGSVFRALVLFNIMLAVQSVMDISVLLGGAALPKGMSLATYAHRGAYPLLVTALLAGAFALAARPFLDQHPALKPLLLVWLAQNVLLTLSAAFRLNLYIDSFGLTYLRVYALIWMGLVAIGLTLVAWQVQRGRSSNWLLLRVTVLSVGTLYTCAFINFAALIATDTLSRAADSDNATRTDWVYLCGLGHSAAKAISTQIEKQPFVNIPDWAQSCVHPAPTHPNWREWDFRTARVNGYLAANPKGEAQ
ncbi:hypothetical protein RUE5091_03142 [Ruegeria denitrificans]|uniref:Uncharacterized protein n=1 Tax=Ruegeria denitrificans TaxID=1715692 RepID=A0A0P1IUW6_9RHOB|nr:DUF4173 domain-containing protein [Ruegeria denitrificans]CUK09137.1 hypothetical protein RUE5091_03142 [Ruegeria denitrificans]